MDYTTFFSFSILAFFLLNLHRPLPFAHADPLPVPRVDYYKTTCPKAEAIVRAVMKNEMAREPRIMASVVRLFFHDCFVSGCDGSVFLDDTDSMPGEKNALANIGSLRAFDTIDRIKTALEKECPGIVSCADLLQFASRDGVVLTGGPGWLVPAGRLDSVGVNLTRADEILPSPNDSTATSLIELFAKFGLSAKDMVALSGSHTIGEARCFSVTTRLYDFNRTRKADPSFNPWYKKEIINACPDGGNENVTVGLDCTPVVFDNQYFIDLTRRRGFMTSDEVLFLDKKTTAYVWRYALSKDLFFKDFVTAMLKMGDLPPLMPGGEIRKNCRVVNQPAV